MTRFVVRMRERWSQYVTVEADSPEEAKVKAAKGEGDYGIQEYDDTLDSNEWDVKEELPGGWACFETEPEGQEGAK